MPLEIIYKDNGQGVIFLLTGTVTGAEVIKANQEIYRSDRIRQQRYQIIDRVQCTEYRVNGEEIRIIAGQDLAAAAINPHIVVALISVTTLQFGMSRMYDSLVGEHGFKTEIFHDRTSAEQWIKQQLQERR